MKRSLSAQILKLGVNFVFHFLLSSAILPALLFNLVFVLIIIVNLNNADVGFIVSPQFREVTRFLNIEFVSIDDFLLQFFFRISFVFAIIQMLFEWLLKILFRKKITYKYAFTVFALIITTILFLTALASSFAEQAAQGAQTIVPLTVVFWIGAVLSLMLYTAENWLANKISGLAELL